MENFRDDRSMVVWMKFGGWEHGEGDLGKKFWGKDLYHSFPICSRSLFPNIQ